MSHQPQQDIGQQHSLSSIDVPDMPHLILFFSLIFDFYYVWWGPQKLLLSTTHVLIANTNGRGRGGGFAGEEEQCCLSLWMSQRTHVEAFVGVNNNMGWCHDTLMYATSLKNQLAQSLWWGDIKASLSMFCKAYNSLKAPIKALDRLGASVGDVYWISIEQLVKEFIVN